MPITLFPSSQWKAQKTDHGASNPKGIPKADKCGIYWRVPGQLHAKHWVILYGNMSMAREDQCLYSISMSRPMAGHIPVH